MFWRFLKQNSFSNEVILKEPSAENLTHLLLLQFILNWRQHDQWRTHFRFPSTDGQEHIHLRCEPEPCLLFWSGSCFVSWFYVTNLSVNNSPSPVFLSNWFWVCCLDQILSTLNQVSCFWFSTVRTNRCRAFSHQPIWSRMLWHFHTLI